MKFLRSIATALGLAFGTFGLAVGATALLPYEGPGQSLTGYTAIPCCENTVPAFNSVINAINSVLNLSGANTSLGLLGVSGRVFSAVGAIQDFATNTGVTIETYTVPANAFDIAGRTIRIHANFHKAANFHAGAAGCGLAANIVSMQIATTSGAGQGTCDFVVTQGTTANTQMYAGTVLFSTTSATTAQVAQLSGTTSNSITTSTASSAYFQVSDPTAAGDIVLDNFEVYYDE